MNLLILVQIASGFLFSKAFNGSWRMHYCHGDSIQNGLLSSWFSVLLLTFGLGYVSWKLWLYNEPILFFWKITYIPYWLKKINLKIEICLTTGRRDSWNHICFKTLRLPWHWLNYLLQCPIPWPSSLKLIVSVNICFLWNFLLRRTGLRKISSMLGVLCEACIFFFSYIVKLILCIGY